MNDRKIYVSVISHGHEQLIINLDVLKRLNQFQCIEVICCDNLPNVRLAAYCNQNGINYYPNIKRQGFAKNNNDNFKRALALGLNQKDYFLLLNPDVDIDVDNIINLIKRCRNSMIDLASANLYLDAKFNLTDDNLREFPRFLNFIKNYCFKDRSTVMDKKNLTGLQAKNYWASGSFLLFSADLYIFLQGLNERFYMYCEDIDICKRALKFKIKASFLSNVKVIHYRQCRSRKFFSREFFWHVKSAIIYSLSSIFKLRQKSSLSFELLTSRYYGESYYVKPK